MSTMYKIHNWYLLWNCLVSWTFPQRWVSTTMKCDGTKSVQPYCFPDLLLYKCIKKHLKGEMQKNTLHGDVTHFSLGAIWISHMGKNKNERFIVHCSKQSKIMRFWTESAWTNLIWRRKKRCRDWIKVLIMTLLWSPNVFIHACFIKKEYDLQEYFTAYYCWALSGLMIM